MVEDDAKDFIVANFENGTYNADTDWEEVCDDMFTSDEVCGNGSQYKHGYQSGYEDGFEAAKKEKYEDMSREYDSGRNLGYEEGYDDVYAAAEVDAYNEGYDEGQKYERQLQKETNFEN